MKSTNQRSILVLVASMLLVNCGRKMHDQTYSIVDSCFRGDGSDEKVSITSDVPSIALIDGMAKIYDRDSQSELIDIPLKLTGDGTLTNDAFLTAVTDGERASRSDLKFIYDKSDPHFEEVSMFANATTTLTWFKSIGMQWDILPLIGLVLTDKIGGSDNTAIFIPNGHVDMLEILITPGDGSILRNLRTDRDILSHQIAHAVIYRNLWTLVGDSAVVHEGLADAFTMLRNDDPCFARTVCPAQTTACVMTGEKSCLRTADNNLNWQTNASESDAHLKGQIISGMLWDLRKSNVMQPFELARIVMRAVEMFNYNSDARDLAFKYVEADKQIYNGIHRDAIIAAAKARGLFVPEWL